MTQQSYTKKIQTKQMETQEIPKRFHIPQTDKVRENLEKQRSRYMKKHGKTIKKDELASLLLETATLK